MQDVFVVEDEPALQFFYKKILDMHDFNVVGIASNGEEAINMFKSFNPKPKVILMDHRMPLKNGIEASKEILQLDEDVKILFFSADDSIKAEAYAIGIFSFEQKPFSMNTIVRKIKAAFEIN
ncbi:MAG: response regulator [Candidatus Helarchaeota archaeon]